MFYRFLIFSGLAAAVNLGVGLALYGGLGLRDGAGYALAVCLAFMAGMGVSFALNRRYTFPASGRALRAEFRDFLLVSLGGMALTTGLAWSLDTYMQATLRRLSAGVVLPETLAHVSAVGLTAFYSFFAHRYISFRRARRAIA